MSASRLKYWSPELIQCFEGATDLFHLSFLDVPVEEMPAQIFLHVKEQDDYSQADRLRLKTVAIRIHSLAKGGDR